MTEYSMIIAENLRDYSLDYEELSGSVNGLMAMHCDLEDKINSMTRPLSMALGRIKRAFGSRPKHTIEDIFRNQLATIKQLRRGIELQSEKSRSQMDELVVYQEEKSEEISEALDYIAANGKQLCPASKPMLISKPKEKQKIDREYLKREDDYIKGAREISEKQHKYIMAAEKIIDLLRQKVYLRIQEELVRNTVHSSERITEKAKRIEDQISITRGLYDSVLTQQKLCGTLYKALETQRTYIAGLDNIVITGRRIMNDIVSKSAVLNDFNSMGRLDGILDEIASDNKERKEELISTIEKYFRKWNPK